MKEVDEALLRTPLQTALLIANSHQTAAPCGVWLRPIISCLIGRCLGVLSIHSAFS